MPEKFTPQVDLVRGFKSPTYEEAVAVFKAGEKKARAPKLLFQHKKQKTLTPVTTTAPRDEDKEARGVAPVEGPPEPLVFDSYDSQ